MSVSKKEDLCSSNASSFNCILFSQHFPQLFLSGDISRTYLSPANTLCWPNAVLMLAHRLRRWANINPALGQCIMFVGIPFCDVITSEGKGHMCHKVSHLTSVPSFLILSAIIWSLCPIGLRRWPPQAYHANVKIKYRCRYPLPPRRSPGFSPISLQIHEFRRLLQALSLVTHPLILTYFFSFKHWCQTL